MSLDALVKEIHVKYTQAMKDFFAVVDNVLSIDGTQNFERAFFRFRTVVKVCNCVLNYNPLQFLNTCIVLGKKLSVYLLFPVHSSILPCSFNGYWYFIWYSKDRIQNVLLYIIRKTIFQVIITFPDNFIWKFQSLEKRLAEILRLSYNHCPTVESQLRLLEVFEGVSGRELVQVNCDVVK